MFKEGSITWAIFGSKNLHQEFAKSNRPDGASVENANCKIFCRKLFADSGNNRKLFLNTWFNNLRQLFRQ
jgi:hypothetical protein